MRITKPRISTAAPALTLAFVFFGPAWAQADDPAGYGDGYQSAAFGRVRAADGGASIVRADAERGETDRATVNAPIFPGDTVRTDGGQRVEIQLAGGTIVRIDRSGEVAFQSLPDPTAKYQDNTVLVLNSGAIRIGSRLGDKEEFRIDTRDASVYLLGEGEFRIEAGERGGTGVASLRGVAEVVGNDSSVLVRGGMRTATVAGSAPEPPRPYSAFASDGFDRWCNARDDSYRVHDQDAAREDRRDDVPEEVQPYYNELSLQGSWASDPEFGTVWTPTGVGSDWRPYVDGYWSYGPGGYFWVSSEPWGWAPYHYGNWQWLPHHGWCWIPGRVFGGAWVSWSWGSLYVGWSPLDFWGRPGWAGGSYYGGYYDPGCWTFVDYGHLHEHDVRRHAVPIGTVRDDLRHATVVARAPSVDPRRLAASPVWRERALQQVADDRAARMRPIQDGRPPERRLSDLQGRLLRRPTQVSPVTRGVRETITAPTIDHRTIAPRPRRIFDDPRVESIPTMHPETRDDVRDLYQRMSRPRETRGPDVSRSPEIPSYRVRPPQTVPRAVRVEVPREPTRDAPRVETPHPQAPRAQAPREQAPRAQAPREQAPRAQAPHGRPQPQSKRDHGDKR